MYHKDDGYISITRDTSKKLTSIIKPHKYTIQNNEYEFNEKTTIIEGLRDKSKYKLELSKYTISILSVSIFSLILLKTII